MSPHENIFLMFLATENYTGLYNFLKDKVSLDGGQTRISDLAQVAKGDRNTQNNSAIFSVYN